MILNDKKINEILQNIDVLPNSTFVALPIVCILFGCSSATVWRRVKQGDIVAPHRIGKGSTRWQLGQIREALEMVKNKKS